MRTIAIIPARGGSKGIPRKNLRIVAGIPLLAHSVIDAVSAPSVERTIVSTDDHEIATVAVEYGAEVVWRPAAISNDTASSESALIHTLEFLKVSEGYVPGRVVFLQATSPIREPEHVEKALRVFTLQHADSLLSVTTSHRFFWTDGPHGAHPLNYDPVSRPRRQDQVAQYVENGSIYIFKPDVLLGVGCRLGGKIALFVMDHWSSFEIDTEDDLELCRLILDRRLHLGGTMSTGSAG